jgi:hypothetical protein
MWNLISNFFCPPEAPQYNIEGHVLGSTGDTVRLPIPPAGMPQLVGAFQQEEGVKQDGVILLNTVICRSFIIESAR